MKKNEVYAPENLSEEALMIMGQINAFAAYVRSTDYIRHDVCAAIFGFSIKEDPVEEPETEVGTCHTLE